LKAELEAIRQQVVEAMGSERANALKEAERRYKEFSFTDGVTEVS
jgi:hypothetical protein